MASAELCGLQRSHEFLHRSGHGADILCAVAGEELCGLNYVTAVERSLRFGVLHHRPIELHFLDLRQDLGGRVKLPEFLRA